MVATLPVALSIRSTTFVTIPGGVGNGGCPGTGGRGGSASTATPKPTRAPSACTSAVGTYPVPANEPGIVEPSALSKLAGSCIMTGSGGLASTRILRDSSSTAELA